MPRSSDQRRAFTLVEVLATIVLIAIVIPVAMQGVTLATRMASHSKRQIQASCLAKSKLSELVASQAWQNTARSGNFGRDWPDYEWKLESTSWRLSSVYELAVRVSWQGPTPVENRSVLLSTLVYAEND